MNPIFNAILHNDIEYVRNHLNDIHVRHEASGFVGYTPLHYAAMCGRVNIARLLLQHGADPNATDIEMCTPLHVACFDDFPKIVELLLISGANANVKTKSGSTPLFLAVDYAGSLEVVRILLTYGASLREKAKLIRSARDNGNMSLLQLFEHVGRE